MPDQPDARAPQLPAIFKSEDQKIMDLLKELSFPRMLGSDGETLMQSKIYQQAKSQGYQAKAENVQFQYDLDQFKIKFEIMLSLGFIILFVLLFLKHYVGAFFLLCALIIIWNEKKTTIKKKQKILESKNIVIEKNSRKNQEFDAQTVKIILVSHYDSISSRITNRFILLFSYSASQFGKISNLLLIPLCEVAYILTLEQILTQIVILGIIMNFFALGSNILLLANKKENKSFGAADNASGISVLLSLMDIFREKEYQLTWSDITFLFSSAEEWGWAGSKAYLAEHVEKLKQYPKVYVINIDTIKDRLAYIATIGVLQKSQLNSNLNPLITHYSNTLKIKISPLNSGLFLGGDHIPFHQAGFESCCICSPLDTIIHTINDSPEKVSPRSILDAVEIIKNIILSIEKQLKIEMGE